MTSCVRTIFFLTQEQNEERFFNLIMKKRNFTSVSYKGASSFRHPCTFPLINLEFLTDSKELKEPQDLSLLPSPFLLEAPRVSFVPSRASTFYFPVFSTKNSINTKTSSAIDYSYIPFSPPDFPDSKSKEVLLRPDYDQILRFSEQPPYNPTEFELFPAPKNLPLKLFSPLKWLAIPFYPACNEYDQEETLDSLKKLPPISNGVHIGFSGLFNLEIIAIRKPKKVFICDVSYLEFEYYSILQKSFLEASNPCDFVSLFSHYMNKSRLLKGLTVETYIGKFPNKSSFGDYLQKTLERDVSWLSDDEFSYIQNLFRNKNIIFLPLNAADNTDNFQILSRYLTEEGLKLDTYYTSNIFYWIKSKEGKENFRKNMETLTNDHSIIIDAQRPQLMKLEVKAHKNSLHQRCFYKREIIEKLII